jgi:hypothetical protein
MLPLGLYDYRWKTDNEANLLSLIIEDYQLQVWLDLVAHCSIM